MQKIPEKVSSFKFEHVPSFGALLQELHVSAGSFVLVGKDYFIETIVFADSYYHHIAYVFSILIIIFI